MNNIRTEIARWVQAGLLIGLWLLLLFLAGEKPSAELDALARIPDVVFIYGILHLVFTTWLWRFRIFARWLVPFPDLEGTWKGALTSTWTDPDTGHRPNPIPVCLAIRQTFSSITVSVYTNESNSVSIAASLRVDEQSQDKRVSFLYTNVPRVAFRDRSIVHDGAAALRVITMPVLSLEGEYWTNRRSSGDIRVEFVSRRIAESFQE